MRFILRTLGKEADVSRGDSRPPRNMTHLPGYADIIDKSLSEMDLSVYDLFISLDSSNESRNSTKEGFSLPKDLRVITIDHHGTNTLFGAINLVVPEYPATAQVLFELVQIWGVPLNRDIAANLFVGLYTDTGGFRYGYTTVHSYQIAAVLVEQVPDFVGVLFGLLNSETPGRMLFRGLALSSVQLLADGHVALATVSKETLTARGISAEDTQGFSIASALVVVEGWDITVSLVESDAGVIRVSMRTRDMKRYDLGIVARALNSGGHPGAMGATVPGTIESVTQTVLTALRESYPDLHL